MPNYNDQTVFEAINAIQRRQYVLPAIQREFVWKPDRICALFDSLMRDYPITSLLYWQVDKEHADAYRWYDFVLNYHEIDSPGCPPHENLPAEDRIAVLDGQQRLTALNIGLRGSHAARAKWHRVGRAQSYPKKFLYLDICTQPRLSEDRYEDQVYRFRPKTVDELVNSSYGQSDTFALLSILYGHVDPSETHHVDHIFPRDKLNRLALRDAGYDDETVERVMKQMRDGLANLQLLPGPVNIGKSAQMPLAWAQHKYPSQQALDGYLARNDMVDLPGDIKGFVFFFDARRERLRDRLVNVLGREPGSLIEPEN